MTGNFITCREYTRTVFFATLFSGVLFSVTAWYAHAATLYMDPSEAHGFRADTVTVSVRADTDEGECINTIDATITYGAAVSAIDVSRGDSIMSLWVEEPVIDPVARTIRFAGGIPNGYCGRIPGDPRLTNTIARIVFQIPGFAVGGGDTKEAEIAFAPETRVLLNDGEGTEAPLKVFGAKVTLDDKPGTAISNEWGEEVANDNIPPSPFSLELVQNDEVWGGKYYIVFSTTDKQSGLDHFEVMEEPIEEISLFKWGIPDVVWTEAKSPYVLHDQKLKSIIRVKAVDKAGNERIAVFAPEETARLIDPTTALLALTLVSAGVIGMVVLAFFLRRFMQRLQKTRDDTQGNTKGTD
ncbi:MAG: hypothetical protein RLZZ234_71 [Candidatus Parcubacteria bacterium]|jgi:hypothetical protein